MQRNLLVGLAVCWAIACYGQFNPVFTDSNPFETMNDIHGPVKQITMPISCKGGELRNGNDPIHNPKDVHIYDKQGRETDWFTAFGQHYVTTYTTHASRTYCYAEDGRLFEYNMVRRYNESGKETLSLYMRGDSVLRMDSMIYNQWGKVAVRYHTEADGEFHVACSYKYDASGNVLGMKNITSEKRFSVTYGKKRKGRQRVSVCWEYPNGSSKTIYYTYRDGILIKIVDGDTYKVFSDFDEYGNWRKMVWNDDKSRMTMIRHIEYYTDIDKND